MRRALVAALVATFALLAGPAFALGLGQIQVKSQAGQPLLAEIPIVSSDPAELENLQARLASPETFARIGLAPPQGAVADLQFVVALDPQGRPVIRVTTSAPVQQPLLTFLVEVDWGQGRLVREYSALLDAPRTVSSPLQPAIQAPTTASSNAIERGSDAAPAETAVSEPAPAPAQPAKTEPARPEAAFPPTPVAAAPLEKPGNDASVAPAKATGAAAAAKPPAASKTTNEYGPVKAGDTLSGIARGLALQDATLDQTMLALLRANPDAFIGGNINLLRTGASLRIPQAEDLSQHNAAEARALVREQIGKWRDGLRKPVLQPSAVAGAETGTDDKSAAAAPQAAVNKPVAAERKPVDKAAAPRTADARLEIVPPSANGGQRAGTQSGLDAKGGGDMLRQEDVQQTRETLAARDAEVQELKARVADLEKLQQDQQKLIAMKDGELAAAQRKLAAQQQPATPAPSPSTSQGSSVALWPWLTVAVVVALLAWLFLRRKAAPAPARRAVFDSAPTLSELTARDAAPGADRAPPPPAATRAPTWHAGDLAAASTASAAAAPSAVASTAATEPATPIDDERLELARAYLDLGDVDTARSLLQEVAAGGDATARGEAARLLRDL
ncbi:FimV/HubP family polar landmark protein [Luteimonas aquatica]|uniref:FimV/HubP family polar landmark protein n=1 Tax=Luteimonas aquatica TaxID=450364 RepID=UPI001F569B14|nr:FimV/HubP family polar landmark protein [Luteimonas aquatica]